MIHLKPGTKINLNNPAPLSFTSFPLDEETAYTITEADAEVMKDNPFVQFLDGKIQPYDYTPPGPSLDQLRAAKLAEVGAACTKTIYAGVDAETSEGVKHFSLEQHDQTELMGLNPSVDALIAAGDLTTPAIPYHADGELCRLWSAADFGLILQAATGHIFYHRTYCNHLNAWIRREEDTAVLAGIAYGDVLPEDLAENMAALLSAGGGSQG